MTSDSGLGWCYFGAVSKEICFVIMPIGKEGSADFAHFRSVFDVIIKPAAEQAGYEVHRADDSALMGNMTNEIVKSLAGADLVIADLTNRNPNVYLELGVRHCLRKSGTIHLVREDQALPFDVAGYRAIKYSTNFAKIDSVREAIIAAISEKRRRPEIADNPVHDSLNLPQDYRSIAESEQVVELEAAQRRLAKVTRELQALKQRYLPEGSGSHSGEVNPELLDEREMAARLSSITSEVREDSLPRQLVVRAQHAASDGNLEELVSVAQRLLRSPFADPAHLRTVARIAGKAGLDELELLVAEQTAAKFPGDNFSLVVFAETCIHTPNPTIKERGKKILESNLGIEWRDGKPLFTKGPIPGKDIRVAFLLDFYSAADRYAEELAVAKAALEVYGKTSITLRCVARAYRHSGDLKTAEEHYQLAVDTDPNDGTSLNWFGSFRAGQRELDAARKLHALACKADPDSAHNVLSLLGVYAITFEEQKNAEDIETMRDLAALAVKRGNGSPAIRSECAQKLNEIGLSEIAKMCQDAGWPGEEELQRADGILTGSSRSRDDG